MMLIAKRWMPAFALLLVLLCSLLAWLCWPSDPIAVPATHSEAVSAAVIERGRYLAVLGNCQECHTQRGGQPFAGGRGIATPFGTIYSSNLTPAPTGLAAWSADDFWRALHHGQSRDGHWLYPAFPFANTTYVARADSDALYAYLHSLAPQTNAVPAHQLNWPFNTQAALKLWRMLYFREGDAAAWANTDSKSKPGSSDDVARGAYLVRGLAHCGACHAPRNAMGASENMQTLNGGMIPVQNWYAPSLANPAEAGLQDWGLEDIVTLLQSGRARDAMVSGPMAEVVQYSTQHWTAEDLRAMAVYLKQLPRVAEPAPTPTAEVGTSNQATGAQLYKKNCAECHGEQGQGVRTADGAYAYPPLAGNRMVVMSTPVNLVHIVMNGGFAPATAGHPRPFGMPPFVLSLNDSQIATILSYVRSQWGNHAPPISELEVLRLRGSGAQQ